MSARNASPTKTQLRPTLGVSAAAPEARGCVMSNSEERALRTKEKAQEQLEGKITTSLMAVHSKISGMVLSIQNYEHDHPDAGDFRHKRNLMSCSSCPRSADNPTARRRSVGWRQSSTMVGRMGATEQC